MPDLPLQRLRIVQFEHISKEPDKLGFCLLLPDLAVREAVGSLARHSWSGALGGVVAGRAVYCDTDRIDQFGWTRPVPSSQTLSTRMLFR